MYFSVEETIILRVAPIYFLQSDNRISQSSRSCSGLSYRARVSPCFASAAEERERERKREMGRNKLCRERTASISGRENEKTEQLVRYLLPVVIRDRYETVFGDESSIDLYQARLR